VPRGTLSLENPKPYVWHKTADEILDSLATYCQRRRAAEQHAIVSRAEPP
jgi:hypothetical protein